MLEKVHMDKLLVTWLDLLLGKLLNELPFCVHSQCHFTHIFLEIAVRSNSVLVSELRTFGLQWIQSPFLYV